MKDYIRLATRKSPLALIQANLVREYLISQKIFSEIEVIPMSTTGDDVNSSTFKELGGKGLFLKELELALLDKTADIAVHSMKDVPTKVDKKFTIISVMKREDPRDVFISNKFKSINDIRDGVVATSSPRRVTQIMHNYKKIKTQQIRGHIYTRLSKLKENDFDGLVLARAGINRINMGEIISQTLEVDEFVPSPGQGILCIEFLKRNISINKKLIKAVDRDTQICAEAERLFADKMQGDCQSPIGAYAGIKNDNINILGYVSSSDGKRFIKSSVSGTKKQYLTLAENLTRAFIKMGSKEILKC